MIRLARFLPLSLLCALAACGGGGGSGGGSAGGGVTPPPPAKVNPEGAWQGTAKSASNELNIEMVADGAGGAYAVLNAADGAPAEALYMTGFSAENFVAGSQNISGKGYYRHVAGGFYQSIGPSAVTVQSGSSQKTLQFQVAAGLGGANPRSVTVNYNNQYDSPLSLASVLGSYTSKQADNILATLTLSNVNPNSMLISGNPACVFSNSRITVLDSRKNLFSVIGIFNGTDCAFTGTAGGVAYATLTEGGQVSGLNMVLQALDGSSMYVFQGSKD
jgi:hypothetical protein